MDKIKILEDYNKLIDTEKQALLEAVRLFQINTGKSIISITPILSDAYGRSDIKNVDGIDIKCYV